MPRGRTKVMSNTRRALAFAFFGSHRPLGCGIERQQQVLGLLLILLFHIIRCTRRQRMQSM